MAKSLIQYLRSNPEAAKATYAEAQRLLQARLQLCRPCRGAGWDTERLWRRASRRHPLQGSAP